MADTNVAVIGDSSHLVVTTSRTTALDPLEFLSGSFRGGPEERRVANVFLITAGGTKTLTLRFEFTDPAMIEHSITGKPVFINADDQIEQRIFRGAV